MVWDSNILVTSCSEIQKKEFAIKIPYKMHEKFLTLVRKIDTEWLLYLQYQRIDKNDKLTIFDVTGYVVPEQEATGTSVKVINAPDGDYGVIHAHQFTDSSFFSGKDVSFINSNNAFSIVINNKGEYLASVRHITPCNKYLLVPAKAYIEISEDTSIVEEVSSKITKPTPSYLTTYYYYDNYPITIFNPYHRVINTSKPKSTKADNCPYMDQPINTIVCMTKYAECEYHWKNCPNKRSTSKPNYDEIINLDPVL